MIAFEVSALSPGRTALRFLRPAMHAFYIIPAPLVTMLDLLWQAHLAGVARFVVDC